MRDQQADRTEHHFRELCRAGVRVRAALDDVNRRGSDGDFPAVDDRQAEIDEDELGPLGRGHRDPGCTSLSLEGEPAEQGVQFERLARADVQSRLGPAFYARIR